MSDLKERIQTLRVESNFYHENKEVMLNIAKQYEKSIVKYEDLVTTQRLLTTISDKDFQGVLNFISSIINKALAAMYPDDQYRFEIVRNLYNGKNIHLNAVIQEFVEPSASFEQLNIKRSIGNGQAQVISYLFTLCMYKVSNVRPLILIDEILTGFTEMALEYIIKITQVFAQEGFQFICVEYSFNNFGTPILVKKNAKMGYSTVETSSWEDVQEYFSQVKENGGTQLE